MVGAVAAKISSNPKQNNFIENMLSLSFAHHIDHPAGQVARSGLIQRSVSAKNVQGVSGSVRMRTCSYAITMIGDGRHT